MLRSEVRFNFSCNLIGNHPQSLTALTLICYKDSHKGFIEFVQFVDTQNDLVKAQNDPVNDPVKTNILRQLKQNPKANYRELAEKTGYSTATIKRHIQELKKSGIIERVGSDKTGSWRIIEYYKG